MSLFLRFILDNLGEIAYPLIMVTETKANAKAEQVILATLEAAGRFDNGNRKATDTADVSKALKAAGLPASKTTTLSHLHRMLDAGMLDDTLYSHSAWRLS